jgi:maltose O-acetyltransferase
MSETQLEDNSEYRKMLAGELYLGTDPTLVAARRRARRLFQQYNQTTADELERRVVLIRELFGSVAGRFEIELPFHCDYGRHISVGDNLFVNFGCVMLDCNRITIGKNAFFGPGVHLYTSFHPLDRDIRATAKELAAPITIGDDVWLGGGTIVCPGVTIGDGVVVGAGSVVVKDLPANVLAVGNPCRIIRSLDVDRRRE